MKFSFSKKSVSIMVIVVLLCSFSTTVFAAYETESNNSKASANATTISASNGGFIDSTDVDYWVITSDTYGSRTLQASGNVVITVEDQYGVIGTKPLNSTTLSWSQTNSGPIYIKVSPPIQSGNGYYGFTLY
ncbi:hypothetical protein [Paenibacillus sinopodophylli]|uniref:hypothetical protein n=1 Tax=Paenibacillus sinopodophylli TaxID=1837342 RepID=UPI00110CE50C|nr:hypothetical protein [Paenibacillus sinopodophylli]